MPSTFSIGVLVSGAMASSFMSTMSGTQRILDKLGTSSQKLTSQQEKLSRATERYGQMGGRAAQRLNSDLERVTRTMAKMEAQQSRLSKWSATGEALKANRMALYGQGVEAYALGRTMLAPAMSAVTNYADYEAEARNIRVTGELTAAQENSLKSSMLMNASATGQFSSDLLKGVGIQVAAGMDATMAQAQAGTMGRVATANQAAIEDLAKLGNAFKQINITSAGDLSRAYDAAGWGATQGNFELKDMAKAMPQMFSAFKARGIVGNQANAEIVASLEAGREGAGSNDEAVTNMSNWLSKMGAQDTVTKYNKAGVDYQGSMNKLVAGGFSQYEASLEIARQFINGKGKAFADKWKNAQGDMAAQQKLAESFGLSEVFTDMQTVNHLVAMTQNWDKYQEIKKGMLGKASEGFTDKAFALQMDTVKAKTQQASVELDILSKTVGQQLAPSFSAAVTEIIPVIKATTQWVSQHPAAIRTIAQLATGIVGFRLALVGAKLGLNLLISPLVSTITTFEQLRSRLLLIRTAFGAGGIFRNMASGALSLTRILSGGLLRGITLVSRAFMIMGRTIAMNFIRTAFAAGGVLRSMATGALSLARILSGGLLRGIALASQAVMVMSRAIAMNLIRTAFAAGGVLRSMATGGLSLARILSGGLLRGIMLVSQAVMVMGRAIAMNLIRTAFAAGSVLRSMAIGAVSLGRVLGGSLLRGITLVGRAVLLMGRAMLLNPIGLLITGIAVGAYLIYRYWGPISNWFRARWSDIKTAFSGGIGGISALIVNWSPLGLFYKAFAGVMHYFNVEMPRNFTEFGSNIISGLVNGISSKLASAKDTITGFGGNVKNWFAETLGIHSPSRVFAGFGDNIVQGAVLGISRTLPLAEKSTQSMASRLVPDLPAIPVASGMTVPGTVGGPGQVIPHIDQPTQGLANRVIPDLPAIPDVPGKASDGGNTAGRSGGIVVTFSPTITIDGKKQEPAGAVRDALNIGVKELEVMLERLLNQKQRRAFD